MILRLSYGYSVDGHDIKDPLSLVQIAEDAMRGFSRASEPGAYLVDNFPLCKSLTLLTYRQTLNVFLCSEVPSDMVPMDQLPS